MSKARCCCVPAFEVSEVCACASAASGFNSGACGCNKADCDGDTDPGVECCGVTFHWSASLDGMLYQSYANGPWNDGDAQSWTVVPYASASGSCAPCTGSCSLGAADDAAGFYCLDPGAGTARLWTSSPSLCSPTAIAWPVNQYFGPGHCSDGAGCYGAPFMSSQIPVRFYADFSGTFRYSRDGSNRIQPSICTSTDTWNPNVQMLSASSDTPMIATNFSIRCHLDPDDGLAYFEVKIAWWPNWDRIRFGTGGTSFGGPGCSGGTPLTEESTVGGSSTLGPSVVVLYRLAVDVSTAQHPCGIGIGSYAPVAILGGSADHPKSLAAFSSVVIS